ncbi:MAG TPA: efflux RND transporter periplasmic adaptor subunit, partial [Pseudomonas sp.]|nr:efflux RND transporter periplasmic adaptor subunit [Pseudomonas sp.]
MNNRIVAALVLLGLGAGYGVAQLHPTASAPAKDDKKALYWYDPMYPQQQFDKPGKSPFMDMQLVPVYANGDDSGGSGVSIDSRVTQNLGIRIAEVKAGRMGAMIEAPGNVVIDERSIQVIQARTTGFVQHVGV